MHGPELTEKERAALNALDLSEILGTPEERIRFALNKAVQYFRERNVARTSEEMMRAEYVKLQAIIKRLPKTADGVPVVPGMKVYPLFPIDDPECSEDDDYATCVLKLQDALTGETFEPSEWIPEKCYSTKKAAEAARKDQA